MRGQGAKGSVKNRIYQFWLIQLFLKRKEKRKQQKLLKQKKIKEEQQKIYQELMIEPVQKWKLIKKDPYIKKETIIKMYPLGAKPPIVVEIYETRKVGIGPEPKKKTYKIEPSKKEIKTTTQKSQIKKNVIEKPKTTKNVEGNGAKTVIQKPQREMNPIKTTKKIIKPKVPTKNTTLDNNLKKGMTAIALTGGTLIAFPALLHNLTNSEKKQESKQAPKKQESKETNIKKQEIKPVEIPIKKDTKEESQPKKETKYPPKKLKLYRTKLEASKEAKILIESEIKKQQSYLKKLNERLQKLEGTNKINYHFRGVFHIIRNLLKFSLGLFTIPFTKNRIFGTAIGLVLMNNGIRGLKNSFKPKENHDAYIEFKEIARAISNESQALSKIEHLIVDSLDQISDLKKELEIQFYGKVPFQEYEDMKKKMESIEQTLLKKQKEMKEMQNHLEKNKIKVKQMETRKDHY